MPGQRIKLTEIVLALMLIAAGCSPGAVQPTPTTVPIATQPPPTPAPTATQLPPTPTPTAAQSSRTPVPTIPEGAFPFGKYSWEDQCFWQFLATGIYKMQCPDGYFVTGTYTVSGDQIQIQEQDCFGEPGTSKGTFTWTYDGKALSFQSLGDECPAREFIVEKHQWLLIP
jgi:hypothetical protein